MPAKLHRQEPGPGDQEKVLRWALVWRWRGPNSIVCNVAGHLELNACLHIMPIKGDVCAAHLGMLSPMPGPTVGWLCETCQIVVLPGMRLVGNKDV